MFPFPFPVYQKEQKSFSQKHLSYLQETEEESILMAIF